MSGYVPLNERPHGSHARLLALADSPGRVLDVGRSSGYLARPLVEAGAPVVGVELDSAAAEEARTVCEEVVVGDIESIGLPFEAGAFDVVLSPVPGFGTPQVEGVAHTVAAVRPSLFAYQFLLAATPR